MGEKKKKNIVCIPKRACNANAAALGRLVAGLRCTPWVGLPLRLQSEPARALQVARGELLVLADERSARFSLAP